MMEQTAQIEAVLPGSLAERIGIAPGDCLLAIDGQPVGDILDYRLALASEQLQLTWASADGQTKQQLLRKTYGQDLGIVFARPTIDQIKLCRNNCQFCFVRQQPAGLRQTLRVRDDDYRLSALQGSFVTLTNLSQAEWQRMLELRLSPLYISVHTTNGELRSRLLQNPTAGQILQQLRELADRQIEMHCQIVLVPGVNDGAELERTVDDLRGLWPAVQSVAVVPVGLTSHRGKLPSLQAWTPAAARQVVDYLLPLAQRLRRRQGVSFAYLADEWFVLADSLVPPRAYYDDFPQIENGVGLLRLLLDEAAPGLKRLPRRLEQPRQVVWVTGMSALPTLRRVAEQLNRVDGLWVDVLPVVNRLFGPSVTVTGLLSGADIRQALQAIDIDGKRVLVPDVVLRPLERDFLDDVSFQQLQSEFPQAELVLTPTNGQALLQFTLGEGVDLCR